jgi:hypothetical protein
MSGGAGVEQVRWDLIEQGHLSEIERGLYIGDFAAAEWALAQMAWSVANVLEDISGRERYDSPYRAHLPILAHGHAQPGLLNRAAHWVEAQCALGRPVLVHCAAGQERSPLTVAWMLARRHNWSLAQAYSAVEHCRPAILVRTEWLPKGWQAWLSR